MKKLLIIILIVFFSTLAFSQQEASVWYFGQNAGIKFTTSGTVMALTDGQINTLEGCATIADATGNLLFYTDGTTVYNRNHQIMVNGTGLMGELSSTQSATIVPKPGSSTLYYIFTLDSYAGINGFRYSEVDITLNGGLGAVTSNKNVLIYTPSCEKLAIVKHANNTDYWVVTHGWNNNTFHSYLLTSSGLSMTPVSTNIGVNVSDTSTDNALGYMKISPDGSKLAICHSFILSQLMDFNTTTGIVSNPQTLYNGVTYGVEFSPNSEVLYISVTDPSPYKIIQFDLTAPNVPGSLQIIYNSSSITSGALQLGPDNKIYIAELAKSKLGVINNPDIIGTGCNLQMDTIDLAGRFCDFGLPPFISSFFFSPAIQLDNACVGNSTSFQLQTNQTITSASWDFGDGSTSNGISPNHTYVTPGIYTVSVTATSSQGTGTKTRDIFISAVPTATQPQDLKICDSDNNGFYTFDLTSQNNAILNGQSSTQYSVRYFANATDYANNIAIATPAAYQNSSSYQPQTIFAEVSNNANRDCKTTTSFAIQVFESPNPAAAAAILPIKNCDNISVGTDNDGKIIFDLTQRAAFILNGQSAANFTLKYYKDNALTQLIALPSSYINTNATETIWVKMTNNGNSNCFATTSFAIEVFQLPVINSPVSLKQCDDNQDGYSAFNLEEAIPLITSSASGLIFSYFETITEAQNNSNPISNPIIYTNQTVNNDTVYIRVQNANGCNRVVQLNLVISTTQIPANFIKTYTVCDDTASGSNTDGVATFDFSSSDSQIRALFPVGQLLDITYYKNLPDALAEQNGITNISSYTNIGYPNSQNIYVRVDSQLNNECLGLGHHITLNAERIPIVQPQVVRHCDDNQDGVFSFNTTNLQNALLNGLTNVTVTYTDQNGSLLPSPLPNPFATTSQTIAITVANNTATACNYSSTVQFIVDDLPEAFPLPTTLTTVCDDEPDPISQNGSYPFHTTAFQTTILGTQTGMIVNYYDANNNPLPSPLPNPFNSGTQNIRVEVINPVNSSCIASMTIPLIVNPVPVINLTGDELICSDNVNFTKIINAGLIDQTTINNFTYTWYLNNNIITGQNSYSLTVNQQGIYTVEVKNANGCTRTRTISVTASNIATITNVEVIDLSSNNSIVINVSGLGNYVYSLDNINFQDFNVFSGLEAGVYTVYIKDTNGCGTTPPKEVSVLGVPNFFTPNGDGYNEYWNIKGVGKAYGNSVVIYIFDRYGKLIKQLSPHGQGWNGTYNGQPVPSDDYWYSIELNDGRIFKGHFALKR